MASPQKENGFTPISNEILEAVAGASLNGTQLRILLLLWRNSYGYHSKECALPLSYLAKMLRGNKSTISRQMRRLEELGLVSAVLPGPDGGGRAPKRYRFNKNYDSWKSGAGPVHCNTQGEPLGPQGVGPRANGGGAWGRTYKDRKITKYNEGTKGNKAVFRSRYDYDDIERKTFLSVTKRLREGEMELETDE